MISDQSNLYLDSINENQEGSLHGSPVNQTREDPGQLLLRKFSKLSSGMNSSLSIAKMLQSKL